MLYKWVGGLNIANMATVSKFTFKIHCNPNWKLCVWKCKLILHEKAKVWSHRDSRCWPEW